MSTLVILVITNGAKEHTKASESTTVIVPEENMTYTLSREYYNLLVNTDLV